MHDELLAAREQLIANIAGEMPKEHREFLIGFKRGAADWNLLGLPEAADLPAVKWRQINLDKLSPDRRKAYVDHLAATLERAGALSP